MLKTALVQHSCSNDTSHNLQRTLNAIEKAAKQGAELITLQELHNSLYFCQQEDPALFDLAETIPGPTTDALCFIAEKHKIVIVSSIFERRASGIYHNTAVVIDKGDGIVGKYRKMHIPDDPGYYEKFYFTPGDLGFQPIQTSVGRIGVLVCWDQWFPEAARLMALAGAELLVYPTAIGWDPRDDDSEKHRQRDAWITIQRGHAIANGVPLIAANRVGHEEDPAGGPGADFWGSSFVAGPQGEILAQAECDSEQTLLVDIDLPHSENVRRIWPFFRDRRIDAYSALTKRYIDKD